MRVALSLGPLFDECQLVAPEAIERQRPLAEWPHRVGVGAIEDLASLPPHMNEPHVAEHLEVLRDGGLPQMQRHDDVADGPFVKCEKDQDVATARSRDGVEDVRGRGRARHGSGLYSY